MKLQLQEATQKDMKIFFDWANEEETRENAFSKKQILWEEHVKWFQKKMQEPFSFLFVLLEGEIPVGQGRVEIEKGVGVISYSIDVSNRGRGLGTNLLFLLEEEMKGKVDSLRGLVKEGNVPSRKAFLKNRYQEHKNENCYVYEKRIGKEDGSEKNVHNC